MNTATRLSGNLLFRSTACSSHVLPRRGDTSNVGLQTAGGRGFSSGQPSIDNSNLAVLIDGDGFPPKIFPGLMTEIANYGTASVRRLYCDWTKRENASWKEHMQNHAISPGQNFAFTTGKNVTDIAMIIDAMDLLYTGRFASFCLVSSDSDFTNLAMRIRANGVTVYGFGERRTPSALVQACDKFIYFDAFRSEHEPTSAPSQPDASEATRNLKSKATLDQVTTARTRRPLDRAAVVAIKEAIANANVNGDDWVDLAMVGSHLTRLSPDLRPKNYGYVRLWDFLEASEIVKLTRKNDSHSQVRLKMHAKDYEHSGETGSITNQMHAEILGVAHAQDIKLERRLLFLLETHNVQYHRAKPLRRIRFFPADTNCDQ